MSATRDALGAPGLNSLLQIETRRFLEEDTIWAIIAWTLFLGRDEIGRFPQRIEHVPKVKQPAESSIYL